MNINLTTHNIQKNCEYFIMILEILSVNYNFCISCTCFEIYIPRKYSLGETSSLNLVKYIYMSQEECARLRESVPYVKVYRYNPKHLYPKLNGYRDNGLRKVGASCGSKYCNLHS